VELSNKIWQELKGAYRILYDASVPLSKLEHSNDSDLIKKIWNELWDELHHQGDVGIASYLAVPQLIRIGIKKDIFDWNLLALCSVIEQQRHSNNNPNLPLEFQENYHKGLSDLKEYVIKKLLNNNLDRTTFIIALSTIATCDGRTKMGKAIMEMEDEDLLDEFLERF